MNSHLNFDEFAARVRAFIGGASDGLPGPDANARFNELALAGFALQFQLIPAYQRLCETRGVTPQTVTNWSQIPFLTTATFKAYELTSIPATERTTSFQSSGTTDHTPSRHYHNEGSLQLYEASLLPWFRRHFLADWDELEDAPEKPGLIILTPSPAQAPHSSLVYMFETARRELGSRDSLFAGKVEAGGGWVLDVDQVLFALRKSMCANRPLALLGTAFSFVHLLDHFAANNIRYRLAEGSRAMETGGYKGRSREMPKRELHKLITRHLGIPATHIITEYGMCELSSQAYDGAIGTLKEVGADVRRLTFTTHSQANQSLLTSAPTAERRLFRFPPWARARIVSPETGRELNYGETGLIQVLDLANVRAIMAVQTEDLGVRRADGFELIGRAAQSEPRGCSLMPITS